MTDITKTFILHHVTDYRNIDEIKESGLSPGAVCSEANMAGCEDSWEGQEMNIEERTREAFDDTLNCNKPKDKPEFPTHDSGVFFWADDTTARYHRMAMDRKNPIGNYNIVQMYVPKIPCNCYEADFQKAEDLFQFIMDNIDDIERINNTGCEDDHDKKLAKETDRLAEDYYSTMKEWSGNADPDKEIICPCHIPKESIVRVV